MSDNLLKLELGCGMSPTAGYVHHDRIKHSPHVDLAWDLRERPWPFAICGGKLDVCGWLARVRNGHRPTPDAPTYDRPVDQIAEAFLDEILALDVFEHVFQDIQTWLDECWRLLKPGGLLDIRVPAWNHELSWRDPTHLRVFHEQSLLYWDPDHELQQKFGSIYFAESNKWWKQEECFVENSDLRFRLRKRG